MTRFRVTLEYDGRPFVGWQRQALGTSVQGSVEAALLKITGEAALVHAAGRTDAGVHAAAMVAHFDIEKVITPHRLFGALNAWLRPAPIAVVECCIAAPDFHARFDCTGREYRYVIVNRRAPLTFDLGLAWRVGAALDADAMSAAARALLGRHDFTTFRSAHCQAASPIRTLDRLAVERHGDRIVVEAAARSFLHHQVRSMVGCLKMVGEGAWSSVDLADALAAKDRTRLGFNAPPDGLKFVTAQYKTSENFTHG
ncbi:tRNA pseudouridine(38-40) synthase TruA [Sphingosinicellaceae bacterium]|nr:tRNA pseudouridine(38-40) synthase TruA [Sphingosinicellaceae bacterium]